jgi:hypothetical protein
LGSQKKSRRKWFRDKVTWKIDVRAVFGSLRQGVAIAQAGLELAILLSQPAESWDYSCTTLGKAEVLRVNTS